MSESDLFHFHFTLSQKSSNTKILSNMKEEGMVRLKFRKEQDNVMYHLEGPVSILTCSMQIIKAFHRYCRKYEAG